MKTIPDTTLYVIRFPNGKNYVGITSMTLKTRFRFHRNAKVGIVRYAIKKYARCEMYPVATGTRKTMAELECFLIKNMQTKCPKGYNLTDGGDGFSSEQMYAYWQDDVFRARTVSSMKGRRCKVSDTHSSWLQKLSAADVASIKKK